MTVDPQTLDQLTTPSLVVERSLSVGDRVRLLPGHLAPTVARHERYWVVNGNDVIDCWPVDLSHR